MDDNLLQQWSDAISGIRASRQASYATLLHDKGPHFTPKDFADVAMASLETALDKWWELESSSEAGEDRVGEMESVVDFEMEAIERDVTTLEKNVSWDGKKLDEEMGHLRNFADQIKTSFQIKIRAASGASSSSAPTFSPLEPGPLPEFSPLPSGPSGTSGGPTPSMPKPMTQSSRASGRSSGGSGVAMFLMFLLGMLIGTGPSIYFWDSSKKDDEANQDKLSQLASEKRALQDNLAVFQQNYADLARGKVKNIAQLEDAMKPIREEMATRRRNVEKDFSTKREGLMKKIPSGDRLDRSIGRLKENRDESLSALEAEEKTRLEPYLRQMQVLKELMSQ